MRLIDGLNTYIIHDGIAMIRLTRGYWTPIDITDLSLALDFAPRWRIVAAARAVEDS